MLNFIQRTSKNKGIAMRKIIGCCLVLSLVACHDVKTVETNTHTQSAKAPTKKLLPKDSQWQFDKFINVTDGNLKKLQSKATVRFTRGDKNLNGVEIYSGCNGGGAVIGFDDKNFRTFRPNSYKGYLTTEMGCGSYEPTENAFINFITSGNTYEFQGEKLILTDTKGQKIQFKPYIPNNDNNAQ